MKIAFSFGATVALLASMANAHTYLSKMVLDGQQTAEGQCIRPYPQNRNFPVKDVLSTDITCGVGGVSKTASETCPVEAGSTITVEWHHNDDSPSDDIIDGTHLGPCMVYMAPLESNGAGDVWFKIFEDGYDAASNTWCVDKIRSNGGKLDVPLPADIKSGDYLLRTEIIALHESDTDYAVNPARGSQFYVNCAQLSVKDGGDAVPEGYSIPGIYKSDSPGIIFNLYSSYTSYPIPGPPVYVSGSGSGSGGEDTDATSAEEPTTQAPSEDTTGAAEETTSASEETEDAPAQESSNVPKTDEVPAENTGDVESNYTDASTEPDAPEATETPESSPGSEDSPVYSTDGSAADASTDAPEEQPTSSAPVHTTTTTVAAPPGKCH
ncbi:hypothetical protein LPJ78_001314 [Coemansia sp. RSA 989]|nr:hypothetical protein LPJ68_000421 [Coemansia sp. RSA 1086]KAJ1753510.1 hypothetical protein LPJ79_000369 [Coemansia sp. RSA 1821]KAJ1867101.1 hypothetical protein LPJ78_001314 [Coemansia sp. RSA 989]KAJ1875255.1 hypothetical protein LPJ55_000784 [Coemansia sp. RSA 990]KAJ2676662.1 hypothetical protein IWW42_000537 [Coemansia sp. RSA 1085]